MVSGRMRRGATGVGVCVLVAGFVVGCASQDRRATVSQGSGPAAASSVPAGPMVRPITGPCVTPSASDIALLAADSDLVERATITATHATVMTAPTSPSGPTDWSTPVTGVTVLGRKAGLSTTTVAAIDSLTVLDPATVSPPGEYVLFLTRAADGTYYTTNGLDGMLRIAGGSVSVQCPNFDDPGHPLQGAGTLSESSLLAMIPPILPAQTVAGKPSPVSSADPATR
jgi:hypothetical protein